MFCDHQNVPSIELKRRKTSRIEKFVLFFRSWRRRDAVESKEKEEKERLFALHSWGRLLISNFFPAIYISFSNGLECSSSCFIRCYIDSWCDKATGSSRLSSGD